MKPRQLRWWSSATLAEAGATLERAWRSWCTEWGLVPGAVTVRNACEIGQGSRDDARWQAFHDNGAPAMWFSLGVVDARERMEALLFGEVHATQATHPCAASIAGEIANVAWRELTRAVAVVLAPGLAVSASADGTLPCDAPRREDAKAWSGALHICAETVCPAEFRIDIHLPAAYAETFMRGRGPGLAEAIGTHRACRPLVPLAIAFDRHPLRLRVELEGLTLDLGTLRSLACGDVITLPHGLHEPLPVRIDTQVASRTVCHAALGAREGRRAIELIRAESSA